MMRRMMTVAMGLTLMCAFGRGQSPPEPSSITICDDPAYRSHALYQKYCSGGSASGDEERVRWRIQVELERQMQELARQERERKARAAAADSAGLEWARRGDWRSAADQYLEALRIDPDNALYRSHLDEAYRQLEDISAAGNVAQMRAEMRDTLMAAHVHAIRQRAQDESNAERLAILRAKASTNGRTYTYAGNGLIAGTSWTVYASRKPGEPEKRMCDAIKQQASLAGAAYDAGTDCQRYQFVLGMATSVDNFTDLKNRVVFDELSNGQFSARTQGLYDKLRGKRFDELGCHSNGAMICLAALENEDAKAGTVVLYGPQVTRESLAMWDRLVKDGKVESVKVYVNENDIVPGSSLAFMDLKESMRDSSGIETALTAANSASLFTTDGLKHVFEEISPSLTVETFPCSRARTSFDCHGMAMYESKVKCTGRSSGKPVAGTGIPGRRSDLPEPPLPCEAIGAR